MCSVLMKKSFRIAVVGGGLVGMGTARALALSLPHASICVLEKESEMGTHQSTHNSGVLHAGLYYQPGSLKAKMAVDGIRLMTAFCREKGIPHEICGKVVVAVGEEEVLRLRSLEARGNQNGLRGLRWLNQDELLQIEPHCAGTAALLVPEEGIVDYRRVCDVLRDEIQEMGVRVRTNFGVQDIYQADGEWLLSSQRETLRVDYMVNCAGLYCDRVASAAGVRSRARIIPFRGEYYQLTPKAQSLVRNLIYPVPDPSFPFLGVHFTRMIQGGVEAGPNAVLALSREGYTHKDFNLVDCLDIAGFSGFWRFLGRHSGMCAMEFARSLSQKLFLKSLQRLVPDLSEKDLVQGGSGVRAQAMDENGSLVSDFWIEHQKNAIHVLNAPSPAATASLAIGNQIASTVCRFSNTLN
jgi:L-2-hydroxyglutarate oxidase